MSVLRLTERRQVQAVQLVRLQELAAQLGHNRFYGPRLRRAELDGAVANLAAFTGRLPLTRKDDLVADQRDHPPFGTNLTYELKHYTRFSQTSATSGTPLRWLDTPASWAWMLDNWTEVLTAAGVKPTDRIFFAFSFGPFLGFWTAFEAATRMGCLSIPGGGMTSAARLQAILDNRVTALCCTPTYAIHLGHVAVQEKMDLSRSALKTILVAGEPGGSLAATRQAIDRTWPGASVFDHHGMTEVGPVSFQCPARAGLLHILEASYLAEVIDPATGRPVDAGARGELVLTTLGRTACPLLRYATGDIVRLAEPEACACGSPLMALDGGILARSDDMVLVRGVNIFPSAVDQIIRAAGGTGEYQVQVQSGRGLTELQITIEPDPSCPDADVLCRQLERHLRDAFHLRIPVRPVTAGTLPRFAMKAKRWIHL